MRSQRSNRPYMHRVDGCFDARQYMLEEATMQRAEIVEQMHLLMMIQTDLNQTNQSLYLLNKSIPVEALHWLLSLTIA